MRLPTRRACLAASVLSLFSLPAFADTVAVDPCVKVLTSDDYYLLATDAYKCLISTPFRPDVAKQLLDYWRTTLDFQSTLAYLRDPPAGYQQAPIDLIRSFDLLRADIDNGVFENQYAFEVAVQDIFYAAHDGHLGLEGSILGIFTFGAPFELATISADGSAIPQVYMSDDVQRWTDSSTFKPSPIKKINGDVAEAWLAVYASQKSLGFIEPHGDWNGIMASAAGDVVGATNALTESVFYPGDTIEVEFENGTKSNNDEWLAYNVQGYGIPTIHNGTELYEYFVLGKMPNGSSNDDTSTDTTDDQASSTIADDSTATMTDAPESTETETASSDDGDNEDLLSLSGWGGAYPRRADVIQAELGYGGLITGYFLNESKIGVVSIPSFQAFGGGGDSFSSTIGEFLQRSKQAGMEKIVIDLQQNSGGVQLLATDTFRQFFPSIDPYSGMRTRSSDLANEIGTTFTNLFASNGSTLNDTYRDALIADPFVVTTEVNSETNRNFSNWAEYFGPRPDHNDQFSTTFRYNLSSQIFDVSTSGIVIYGYGNRSENDPQPYAAKDIVLLTDAFCGSTCDLFAEMMHHEAGVRTVVVGGLPQYGPMQARGGTRGAYEYDTDNLDGDMQFGCTFNSSLCNVIPDRDFDSATQSTLSFNLADQIRPRESTPLQFVYEAADCRIFWTPETFTNYTKLWLYAAEATWSNASKCVQHSAEHNDTMRTDTWGPSKEQKLAWAKTNPAFVAHNNASLTPVDNLAQLELGPGLHQAVKLKLLAEDAENIGASCSTNIKNKNRYVCRPVEKCSKGVVSKPVSQWMLPCEGDADCPSTFRCLQETEFQKRTSGWLKTTKRYCQKPKTGIDEACRRKADAAASPPVPVATALGGGAVDFEYIR